MGNPVYESVLSRLVQIRPLLARGLLDAGLSHYGFDPERVTAAEMNRVVDEFLSQQLAGVDIEGVGDGLVVAGDELLHCSEELADTLFGEADVSVAERLSVLEELGILLPRDAPLYRHDGYRLTLRAPYEKVLFVGRVVVPGPENGHVRVSWVRDVTLQEWLRHEVTQVQRALEEAEAERERMAQEVLEQERQLSRSLQQSLEARERELLHGERLASMGALMGGLAHELNNLLGSILGHAQLIGRSAGADDAAGAAAGRIEEAARSAATSVRTLLQLADARVGDEAPGDIGAALGDVRRLMDRTWRSRGIAVDLAPDEANAPTSADMGQLRSILLNLLLDATQSIEDAQRRRFDGSRHPGAPGIAVRTRPAGSRVELCLEVRGGRLEEEPTHQEPGRSMRRGGLAIVRGVVSAASGTVRAEVIEGEGDAYRVSIELPLARSRAELGDQGEGEGAEAGPGPGRRALVVDDEPALADLIRIVLSDAGFVVDTALCGVDALDRLHRRSYDVVISDIRMPEMDGLQLVEQLRGRDDPPALLLITGDLLDDGLREHMDGIGARVLYKPFDLSALLAAVEEALGE